MTVTAVDLACSVSLAWPLEPADIRLDERAIHVWSAALDDADGACSRLYEVLSPDERARASKFHRAEDRRRFIARRGILRALLARYLRQDAATIEFTAGRGGKPRLAGSDGGARLHFNASHSGTLALLTVAATAPVGVDVERLRPVPDLESVAARFFAPADAAHLTSLPTAQRLDGFFACWTRSEAWWKAAGTGIALRRSVPACLPAGWQIQRLWPAPGYAAALAYRQDSARVSLWRIRYASLFARDHEGPAA